MVLRGMADGPACDLAKGGVRKVEEMKMLVTAIPMEIGSNARRISLRRKLPRGAVARNMPRSSVTSVPKRQGQRRARRRLCRSAPGGLRLMNDGQHTNGIRPPAGPFAGLARLLRRGVIAPMRRRICRRACERALMRLDDHLLRDIGLTRSDAEAITHGLLTLADASAEEAEGHVTRSDRDDRCGRGPASSGGSSAR